MDVVLLSRIQFAVTVGFHFLFPPTTFALTLMIVILETLHQRRGEAVYRDLSIFLTKILGLVFVLGTATGIVMEFSFGNNWARYSRLVGDIFGAPLAAEGVFAFFLESVFLGVLVFGRNRVSPRMHRASAWLVFFGAHLSGLWIIIANSWMQTPAGFRLENGRAVLTDFWAAAVNHSTGVRYLHTVLAGWITGALLLAAIAAWYLLKGRFLAHARVLLRLALVVFILTALVQLGSGHAHAVQVGRTQPAKMAAFEGLWHTRTHAPLSLFGIPDEKNETTHFAIGIPAGLSLLLHFDPAAEVQGLDRFPREERPPVALTFFSYHVMIGLGVLFILIALWALFLWWRKRLDSQRLFLRVLLFSAPLGYLACETGWMAAEVGRQPYAVYGVLKTAQAATVTVPAWQILFSLAMFVVVFIVLGLVFLKILKSFIQRGPENPAAPGY